LEHHVSPATLARFRAIAESDRPPAPPRPPAAT
jgi:hypothetical protein